MKLMLISIILSLSTIGVAISMDILQGFSIFHIMKSVLELK